MIQIVAGQPIKCNSPFKLHNLLAQVAAEHGVPVPMLTGPRRERPLPRIRAEFCRLAYQYGEYSVAQIGRVLHRDHTSVLYLLGKLKRKPSWERPGVSNNK